MNALSLRKLNKHFGQVHILKDIDLEVQGGEFVVFVGPSGCGKSTLLRLIAGLEDASSGQIEIAGQDVARVPPAQRGIAMVFQTYALYPHLSVRGNLSLALKQERQPRNVIDQRVEEAARMLEIGELLERRPAELSGGQRQRVAIGRAIVRKPKLFLFDEPLSNLDAALRTKTRVEIAQLHRSLAATMIYVTHDQTEAMTLADRIVVLREGCVEQTGTPMELYNHPANRFVAEFLGSPPMNFLPASLLDANDNRTLGIRPEDLRLDPEGPLSGRVIHTETLGGDTHLILDCAGHTITVRVFGQHEPSVGQPLALSASAERCHYFDQSGQRA